MRRLQQLHTHRLLGPLTQAVPELCRTLRFVACLLDRCQHSRCRMGQEGAEGLPYLLLCSAYFLLLSNY